MTPASGRRLTEVRESVRRHLWQLSNGMCAKCRCELSAGLSNVNPRANVAHISALGDRGPRANGAVSVDDRNSIENLLLLCPSCHDVIDSNPADYSIEGLLGLKSRHETWCASLRKSGQLWSFRFLSVDFINLPRVLSFPGGDAIFETATSLGIDGTKPLTMCGTRSGAFVGRVKPILEGLSTRAIALDSRDLGTIRIGSIVSFEAPMRSRGTPHDAHLDHLWMDWGTPPQLEFVSQEVLVAIRFDPLWLTTSTAFSDLFAAESEDVVYSGLGSVVSSTRDSLRISALVFGKPLSEEVAALKYALSTDGAESGSASVRVSDFAFRPPKYLAETEAPPSDIDEGRDPRVIIALRFDEDLVL